MRGEVRCLPPLTAVMVLMLTAHVAADEAAVRGAAVVEQWCRMCHLHAGDAPDRDMAPPFEEVVTREGRDQAYFLRFMQEDHFPMTTFRLFDHEKADVIAYLMSLHGQGTSRP